MADPADDPLMPRRPAPPGPAAADGVCVVSPGLAASKGMSMTAPGPAADGLCAVLGPAGGPSVADLYLIGTGPPPGPVAGGRSGRG